MTSERCQNISEINKKIINYQSKSHTPWRTVFSELKFLLYKDYKIPCITCLISMLKSWFYAVFYIFLIQLLLFFFTSFTSEWGNVCQCFLFLDKHVRMIIANTYKLFLVKIRNVAGPLTPDVLWIASFSHQFLDVIYSLIAAHSSQLLCDLVEGVQHVPSHVSGVPAGGNHGQH